MTAGDGPDDDVDEVLEVTFEVADMAFDPWVLEPLVLTKKAALAGGWNGRTIRRGATSCQRFGYCDRKAANRSSAGRRHSSYGGPSAFAAGQGSQLSSGEFDLAKLVQNIQAGRIGKWQMSNDGIVQ